MTKRLVDRTLRAFSDDLSSDAAVPGGGSAAAYAGALGAALAAMVARIAARKSDDGWFADYVTEMDNLRAAAFGDGDVERPRGLNATEYRVLFSVRKPFDPSL